MKKKRKETITASELMKRLQEDPDYKAKIEEIESRKARSTEEYFSAADPVFISLAEEGIKIDSNNTLSKGMIDLSQSNFEAAVPILVKWLSIIDYLPLREDIVRSLAVPWTDPKVAKDLISLIDEESRGTSLTWATANTLAVIADEEIQEDLIRQISNEDLGSTREMLILALGNIQNDATYKFLTGLLDDQDLAGHVIMALGKNPRKDFVEIVTPFLEHEKEWIRNEAEKLLLSLNE